MRIKRDHGWKNTLQTLAPSSFIGVRAQGQSLTGSRSPQAPPVLSLPSPATSHRSVTETVLGSITASFHGWGSLTPAPPFRVMSLSRSLRQDTFSSSYPQEPDSPTELCMSSLSSCCCSFCSISRPQRCCPVPCRGGSYRLSVWTECMDSMDTFYNKYKELCL